MFTSLKIIWEIDFYVPSENLAIQVSMQVLDNIDTRERETRAFVKLNNFIPDSKMYSDYK